MVELYLHSPYVFMVWYLIKQGENFALPWNLYSSISIVTREWIGRPDVRDSNPSGDNDLNIVESDFGTHPVHVCWHYIS
jgi:hypothetical protein